MRADLTAALKDGYLRRVATGPQAEPTELWVHRQRCALPAGAPERERVVAIRLRRVRALVVEALAFDSVEGAWAPSDVDWPAWLERELMHPPVVEACTVDAGLEPLATARLDREGLWLAGAPGALLVQRQADHVVELCAHGECPPGTSARFRLVAVGGTLDFVGASGASSHDELLAAAERWEQAWKDYRARQESEPALPIDPQFEWATAADLLHGD
jgi:hypothetical protein